MQQPVIMTRNLVVTGTSSFSIDFDVTIGQERIKWIAGGGAVDDYNYIMNVDLTGQAHEFYFDFLPLKREITSTNTLNVVIRIMDVDDHMSEFTFSKNYAVEAGKTCLANPSIVQRRDGSRLVDITYDYLSPNEIDPATVTVELSSDWGVTWTVPVQSMIGDVGSGIQAGTGRKVTWNPNIDLLTNEVKPLSAKITLVTLDGLTVNGEIQTGTLLVSPPENEIPVLSVTADVSVRYSRPDGPLYKNESITFEALE